MGVVCAFLVLVMIALRQARLRSSVGCPRLTTTVRASRQPIHPLDSGDTPSTISSRILFRPKNETMAPNLSKTANGSPRHQGRAHHIANTKDTGPRTTRLERPLRPSSRKRGGILCEQQARHTRRLLPLPSTSFSFLHITPFLSLLHTFGRGCGFFSWLVYGDTLLLFNTLDGWKLCILFLLRL